MIKKIVTCSVCLFFLCGCSALSNKSVKYFEEKGCEAVNFDTLLLSKGRVSHFIDMRSAEERNFQNGLFSIDEYCEMGSYSLTEILAKFGERTKYANLVSVKQGSLISMGNSSTTIEIAKSNLKYTAPKSTFNFVAIKGNTIKKFRENEIVSLDGVSYSFHNLTEYKTDKRSWKIGIQNESNKQQNVVDLNKNYFVFGNWKIIF